MGTFEMAVNNEGHLYRALPEAVFLSRPVAKELVVPFAAEAKMEEYLYRPVEMDKETERDMEKFLLHSAMCRALSYPGAHRPALDASHISARGLLPTAWSALDLREPHNVDMYRSFPKCPAQWVNRGVWMEIPYAVSCMVHKLEESSAVWQAVKAEYSYSQEAGLSAYSYDG